MAADISLQGISKAYGATVALDNISLEVADGELLVVLGLSGCGKSTLNAGWLLILNLGIAVTATWHLAAGARRVEGLPVLVVSALAAVVMLAGRWSWAWWR